MFYEVKGAQNAKPLVLVHGFGPGASSYEWRKNVDALAEQYRVYVLDLLGFGLSDRSPVDYTPETYVDLLGDFIHEVIDKPSIVVGHGLTCAYVVANAYRKPQLFERVILVAPPTAMLQKTSAGPLNTVWKGLLRTPILGQFVYNIVTSRQAIRGYYDAQGYHNPGLISDDLVEYVYTSAHQKQSRYAAASFLSHHLALDVHEELVGLKMPIIIVLGRETRSSQGVGVTGVANEFQRLNPRIEVRIVDRASYHVQDEQPAKFNEVVREYANATV
jgi:pimeloyl-ACP methyl ester carboxylesterase